MKISFDGKKTVKHGGYWTNFNKSLHIYRTVLIFAFFGTNNVFYKTTGYVPTPFYADGFLVEQY